jgi:hypothetical protein
MRKPEPLGSFGDAKDNLYQMRSFELGLPVYLPYEELSACKISSKLNKPL